MAVAVTNLDFGNNSKALNLLNPTNAQDAATKIYVDNSVTNISNGMIVVNEFTALTTSVGNWAPNDILIRFQVTTNAGAITSTIWYTSSGATLATAPIVGTDVEDLDRTRNSRLASIDTKTPALGQALAVSSTPVVLTAAQVTTLTPLSSVSIANFPTTQPVSVPTDADNTATGALTASSQAVTLIMGGKSAVGIVITGAWLGTINFEGSVDGTNWNAINAVAASTSTPQSNTNVNGLFRLTPAGLLQVRAITSIFSSGTATLTMRASAGTGGTFANQIVPTTLISNPPEGLVSTGNSSTVNIAANAVFTGTAEDVTNYASIKINVYSSHASATNGLSYQQSHDGILWFPTDNYSIPALTQKSFSTSANIKFFRVIYTNGATATTTFVLQTLYHKSDKQPSSVRPQDGRANDNDFIEGLAFLMGYNSIADAWNRVGVMAANINGNETLADKLKVNASLRMLDTAQAVGSQLVGATGTQAGGLNVNVRNSSNLVVTATGVSGAAVTLTLPAVAGQFHYITSINISIYATAARTGAATPVVVTTTNITGAPAFTFETAQAIGTITQIQGLDSSTPLKSTTINTATTIVAPIATAGIWRITATYFTAP